MSFPLESIEQSPSPPRAAGMGGRLKVEARVVVPRREQPAVEIAFEFGSRQREREQALEAMSRPRKPEPAPKTTPPPLAPPLAPLLPPLRWLLLWLLLLLSLLLTLLLRLLLLSLLRSR